MKTNQMIDYGLRTVLEFDGPDAVRYLNGQMTQDVRIVQGSRVCLPACVTDAKGRIQFRVWISSDREDKVLVDAPSGMAERLSERLTKYLIADDVEVKDRSGSRRLFHLLGTRDSCGITSTRYGIEGLDCWVEPEGTSDLLSGHEVLAGDRLKAFRISHSVPMEGSEPIEGSFPAELGLDTTDVSFHKGCYIGQEVISRIQTVKKVNRRLCKLRVDADFQLGSWSLETADGKEAGVVTSVSPLADGKDRLLLAMVRRARVPAFVVSDGQRASLRLVD